MPSSFRLKYYSRNFELRDSKSIKSILFSLHFSGHEVHEDGCYRRAVSVATILLSRFLSHPQCPMERLPMCGKTAITKIRVTSLRNSVELVSASFMRMQDLFAPSSVVGFSLATSLSQHCLKVTYSKYHSVECINSNIFQNNEQSCS